MSVNPDCAINQELNLTALISSLSVKQITTFLLVLYHHSGAESSQLVSSLSAYEHLYFDLELFESDLPLQFLSYLVLSMLNVIASINIWSCSAWHDTELCVHQSQAIKCKSLAKGWFIIRANFIWPGWLLPCVMQLNLWLPSSSSVSIGNSGH